MDSQDIEQLFSQDANGLFHLVFRNSAGYERIEIEQIFSHFGKVYSVKECGDKFGYRFVRYKHYDEIVNAIKGLRDHPQIKLAPPRTKKENDKSRNYNDNQNDQGHRSSSNGMRNSYDNKKETTDVLFRNNCNINEETKSQYENNECKINYSYAEPNNGNKSKLSSSSDKNSVKSLPSDSRNKTIEEEIPDLIGSNGKGSLVNNTNNKKVIIDAGEIIVGNIHQSYGAGYILHLLDSFEPIAISNVNVVPKSNIRYCHVYFKSVRDCELVERFFDRVDLSGQKLIVQQPCNLIAKGVN